MKRCKQWLISRLSELKNRPLTRFLRDLRIGPIDIGATGGLEPCWHSIQDNVRAFLFEPDESSCQNLEQSEYIEQIFRVALGSSESESLFNFCRNPAASSLLEPNDCFLSRFPNAHRFDVISRNR